MSHEYRMEQLRAAIAAARKNFKKDANFFVVGLTYGCRRECMRILCGRPAIFKDFLKTSLGPEVVRYSPVHLLGKRIPVGLPQVNQYSVRISRALLDNSA